MAQVTLVRFGSASTKSDKALPTVHLRHPLRFSVKADFVVHNRVQSYPAVFKVTPVYKVTPVDGIQLMKHRNMSFLIGTLTLTSH